LDAKETWKIDAVIPEHRDLTNALIQSYRRLSDFARKHATNSLVSGTELNVLGHKLYAAFERKAGKVERVNRGISPNLVENQLSLHELGSAAQPCWSLYRTTVSNEESRDHAPLKRSHSFIEALAWCYFNQLIGPETRVSFSSKSAALTMREFRQALSVLEAAFPGAAPQAAGLAELATDPQLRTACLFVNIDADPMDETGGRSGLVASDRNDALSYGGLHRNLARTFGLVLETSWEEIFTFRYTGAEGLMQCLCEFLSWRRPDNALPELAVNCFNAGYGAAITRRIALLFHDVGEILSQPDARYVIDLDSSIHLLDTKDSKSAYRKFTSRNHLSQSPLAITSRNHLSQSPLATSRRAYRRVLFHPFRR
jgi:adenylate cyclase class 1